MRRVTAILKIVGACLVAISGSASAADEPFAADIRQFMESDRLATPEPCQVLFVGSSSIVRWASLTTDMAPLPVINRGFGGSQISDINHWFDQVVAPYRPRAIVFYAGDNDIDAGKSPEQVASDFDAFMTRKSKALGPTPVYFISVKPSKLRIEQLGKQSRLNELIKGRVASRTDLHYVDVVPLMLEAGKPKDLFMPDNLHMRPEGYRLWTEVVRAALLPNTESEANRCRRADARGTRH